MKKTALSIFFLLAFLGTASKSWALRFAYVDVGEVFDQYDGTKKAKEDLKKQATKKRKELEPQQDELRHKIEDLQAKKSVYSSKKYESEENKLKQDAQDLQNQIQTVQEDLANDEKKMTKTILDEIRGIIKDMAQSEKYDFIFEKSTLLYGGDDVTYKVVKQMNKK
jgi:Skp family chaperone for outer membrane proteins